MLCLAVSPNGSELAVLFVRGNGTTLRIYSVTSGAALRSWTAVALKVPANGYPTTGVSWTADSRQVAFSTASNPVTRPVAGHPSLGSLQERVIDVARSSGNLATASKVILKAPSSCSSLLLTPDGGTVVCGTEVAYLGSSSSADCGKPGPAYVAYSAATGRLERVLDQDRSPCDQAVEYVLWADAAARHVIGESWVVTGSGPTGGLSDSYGVAAAGTFTGVRIAPHGQWYGGPAF